MENLIKVTVRVYYGKEWYQYLFATGEVSKANVDKIHDFIVNCPAVRDSSSAICEDDGSRSFWPCCVNREHAVMVLNKIEDILKNPSVEENSTPENNSISSEIDYIAKNLDNTDLFLQLAEEAAELSQACLKYVRAYRGNNPTKDSEEVYLKNILEELTDVRVSADVLNIEEDIDTYINKIHRWADRIRSKNAGEKK